MRRKIFKYYEKDRKHKTVMQKQNFNIQEKGIKRTPYMLIYVYIYIYICIYIYIERERDSVKDASHRNTLHTRQNHHLQCNYYFSASSCLFQQRSNNLYLIIYIYIPSIIIFIMFYQNYKLLVLVILSCSKHVIITSFLKIECTEFHKKLP